MDVQFPCGWAPARSLNRAIRPEMLDELRAQWREDRHPPVNARIHFFLHQSGVEVAGIEDRHELRMMAHLSLKHPVADV